MAAPANKTGTCKA